MDIKALDSFIALVELDSQVLRYGKEQQKLTQVQAQARSEKVELQRQLQEKQSAIHTLKKQIDALSLDLKVIDEQLAQKKMRLSGSSSVKEYFSLEQEIKALTEERGSKEDTLFSFWESLESQQKTYTSFEASTGTQLQQIDQQLMKLDKEIGHITGRIKQLGDERPQLVSVVPQELQDQYASMLQSVPNPAVPVIKDACSGCYYSLTAQQLHKVQDNLIRCAECSRLLYALQEIRDNI